MAGMTEVYAQELVEQWSKTEPMAQIEEPRDRLMAVLTELVSSDVVADVAEGDPLRDDDDRGGRSNLILVGDNGVLTLSLSKGAQSNLIGIDLLGLSASRVSAKCIERSKRDDGRITREWNFGWPEISSWIAITHEVGPDGDGGLGGALKLAEAAGWPAP